MDTWVWIVIAAAAMIVVLVVVWSAARAGRTRSLKGTFGREYDRTVEQTGDKRAAESELRQRQKQHDELDIRPLPPESRERYVRRWQSTQTRFVDDPKGAVAEADTLVQDVMKERGYPTDDFDRRVADISVEHPELVEKYRTAHGIALASERNEASTEDLRHSVRHYRALFSELVETDGAGVEDVDSREVATNTSNVQRLR